MILKDGTHWEPTNEDVIDWQRAYKDIDVIRELDAMTCWCEANPAKRKTKAGIKRFCNSWLNRANQTGGSPPQLNNQKENKAPTKLRDWDTVDFLTHDFMDNELFRQKMLKEHGRYMSVNGERVYAK